MSWLFCGQFSFQTVLVFFSTTLSSSAGTSGSSRVATTACGPCGAPVDLLLTYQFAFGRKDELFRFNTKQFMLFQKQLKNNQLIISVHQKHFGLFFLVECISNIEMTDIVRWFLEEAAGFLAKELRDWSQADGSGEKIWLDI